MTAEGSSTDTITTYYLGLVSDTDLSELNSCLKYCRKIFYQLSEIDSSISCKVKQNLVVIKSIFRIDKLHLKIVLFYLLKTNLEGLFLFFLIGLLLLVVLGAGGSEHSLQGLNHLAVLNIPGLTHHCSILDTTGGLNNYMITLLYFILSR